MERLARLIMGKKVDRETIDGVEMTRISIGSGETVYGYTRGSALLLALDPHPVVTAVHVRDGEDTTLQQAGIFVAVKSFWTGIHGGRPLLYSFVNAPQLRLLFQELPDG